MLFTTKTGKACSLKPGDKRRLSMLNSDFKIITGLDATKSSAIPCVLSNWQQEMIEEFLLEFALPGMMFMQQA